MEENFKILSEKFLEINININSLLLSFENFDNSEYFYEEIEKNFELKEKLLQKILEIRAENEKKFKQLKENTFLDLWVKITFFEQENLAVMQAKQNFLLGELQGLKKISKVMDSYKYNKDIDPRLFDISL